METVSFENSLQRRIWLDKAALIPFEISTAWITDEELLESCGQFYQYTMDGYDDILKYPVENFIDPFDPVFDFRPGNRDVGRNTMEFHRGFHRDFPVRMLKFARDVFCDRIVLDTPVYTKAIKNMKTKYPTAKYIKDNYNISFTFDDMMRLLERRGLNITVSEMVTVITSDKYPHMFTAMKQLYDAAQAFNKKTRRTPQYYGNMDFRAIENPFRKPELSELYYPLTIKEKELLDKLNDYAVMKKLKCKYGNLCGIREASFTYKKIHVMSFYWRESNGLKIRITLPLPASPEHELLLNKINQTDEPNKLIDFCLNNLYECLFCSKSCVKNHVYKKKWSILGRPAPVLPTQCWGLGSYFTLDKTTLELSCKMIDLLTEVY